MLGLSGRAAVRRDTARDWIRGAKTDTQHTLLVKIMARGIISSVAFLLAFHLKLR